jgi:hypothetical protein
VRPALPFRSAGPRLVAAVAAAALALSACATDGEVAGGAASIRSSSALPSPQTEHTGDGATSEATSAADTHPAHALPSAHVHAVSRDAGTGDLLVATHEGLYVYGKGEPRKVGPTIDLMGFTVAGPRHYYASGHPGPGVDLPQPAGLLESRDGGQTWTVLSRGGTSDFHALAAAGQHIVGFDGTLRTSRDGRTWTDGDLTSPPRALAMSPDGARVLATTAQGLMSSADGGQRWTSVRGAPLLLLVDWADEHTVVGTTPQGELHLSTDAGQTWHATKATESQVQALDATGSGSSLLVAAATGSQLVTSRAGEPFPR